MNDLQLKRVLRSVLLVLLLNAAGMGKMYAQSFTVGDLNYWVNDDGVSVTVTGHINGTSATGSLVIPETVEYSGKTYSVTTIDNQAFFNCWYLTGDLVIPNSVTIIGGSAFSYCWGFNGSLIIGNSVTSIGGEAFFWCEKLTSVSFPNTLKRIGGRAFNGCTRINSFSIGESVTHIGSNAFHGTGWYNNQPSGLLFKDGWCLGYKGDKPTGALVLPMGTKGVTGFILCTDLTSVSFPSSLMYICDQAFDRCTNLTGDLIIPNSVTTIGIRAFSECSGLTGNLVIGNSVTSIGEDAFILCSFNSVQYNGDVAQWCGISFGDITSTSANVFNCNDFYIGGELVDQLVIPETVTSVGQYAFAGCGSITSVTIPTSVIEIGDGAFAACNGISVYYEGDIAQWCGISFGDTFPYDAGYNLYIEDELITQLDIPETVTSIGQYCFCRCNSLFSVTIPNSVTTIGSYAFNGCCGIDEIIMLNTVPPTLGTSVFCTTNPNFVIYVPSESLNDYKTANNWRNYEPYIKPMFAKNIGGYASSIINDKWYLIAFPFAEDVAPTEVLNLLSEDDEYDLFQFDQSAEGEEWRNYKVDSFNLVNGRGYLYAKAVDVNLIVGGVFNEEETKVVNLDYDAGKTNAGWNLVGNPFPVDAYIDRTYYVMNSLGSVIFPIPFPASTPIPPCTGVFVKAEGEGETVVFTRAVP